MPEFELSVVIPCRNGAATIDRQLRALAGQVAGGTWEVVVADNGSTDNSIAIVAGYQKLDARFRVVDAGGRPGINHARNAGIRASSGTYIAFCDADDVVDPGWVEACLSAFRTGAALIGGPLRLVSQVDGSVLVEPTVQFDNNLGFLPWPAGANCGFTRAVYDQFGPMDETLLGGADETEFFWRAQLAGHALVFVPDATISYVQRDHSSDAYRQFRQFGRSHVKLYKRFRAHGMPKSSAVAAAAFWLSVPVRVVLAVVSPTVRYWLVRDVAERVGRLRQSIVDRVVYL